MPAYNVADHITPAIESILTQSMAEFELIVVDESTDETPSIVDSFDDDRIRLVRPDENDGIPAARNKGLKEARGEYVACHDADDRSHPDRFEQQHELLETHDDIAAIGTGARLVDEDGAGIGQRRVLVDVSLSDLVEENHFVHGSMMFRRSALEAVGGYDEWFRMAEDFELYLRLATEFELRNIDEPLYELRIHEESTFGSQLEEGFLYTALAVKKTTEPEEWARLKKVADRDGIRAITDHLSRRERKSYHHVLANSHLRYGRSEQARDHVRQAITVSNPSPKLALLYVVSLTPPTISELVRQAYQRLFLNPRLRLANARKESGIGR